MFLQIAVTHLWSPEDYGSGSEKESTSIKVSGRHFMISSANLFYDNLKLKVYVISGDEVAPIQGSGGHLRTLISTMAWDTCDEKKEMYVRILN